MHTVSQNSCIQSFTHRFSCPTECRLSRSDAAWKCQVYLRRITNASGVALAQVKNEHFGDVIHDKALVEERIRRAQRAILNPNRPATDFLYGEDEEIASPELTFTNNYISLEISGPDVADLSFCDLPGETDSHQVFNTNALKG